ncbi:MAG TPA: hypothetical protein VN778_03050 [Verrucomicrobiae bacterium]|nr:hypothetical protein [Verrucomicrobiae bacterium]
MATKVGAKRVIANRTLSRVIFDDGMYVVALVTPVLTLPQVFLIWSGRQTAGVSLPTWAAYTTMSGVWLIYGILQHQKPLVISQVCLFVVDFAIVLGIALFR